MISNTSLEDFIRLFLFEHQQQSIRWLTHTFLSHLYNDSSQQFQDHLCRSIPSYGQKAFQYIDLFGDIVLKNKDNRRTIEFLPELESMLKEENQRLFSHPNALIYRRLSTIIDIEQNNGYYCENEPCLICNNPNVPYQQMTLQSIKLDQRDTIQAHIIKLPQAYSMLLQQLSSAIDRRSEEFCHVQVVVGQDHPLEQRSADRSEDRFSHSDHRLQPDDRIRGFL